MEFITHVISHDWIQCSNCGWIGKTKSASEPHLNGLVSCPACTNLSVKEYYGPTVVEMPVELLSDIQAKLCVASFMLGNKAFSDEEYLEINRQCIQFTWKELVDFMREKNLLHKHNDDDVEQPTK